MTPWVRKVLPVLSFHGRHVAIGTGDPGPVMDTAGEGFCFRMLELDQPGTGNGMLEIEKIEFLVMGQEVLSDLLAACDWSVGRR